jgi:hypothetical protein
LKIQGFKALQGIQGKIAVAIKMYFRSRVTRLGELSPSGRLFSLGSLLKVTEGAYVNFLAYFFHSINYVLNLTKNGLGYTLGDFFTN